MPCTILRFTEFSLSFPLTARIREGLRGGHTLRQQNTEMGEIQKEIVSSMWCSHWEKSQSILLKSQYAYRKGFIMEGAVDAPLPHNGQNADDGCRRTFIDVIRNISALKCLKTTKPF